MNIKDIATRIQDRIKDKGIEFYAPNFRFSWGNRKFLGPLISFLEQSLFKQKIRKLHGLHWSVSWLGIESNVFTENSELARQANEAKKNNDTTPPNADNPELSIAYSQHNTKIYFQQELITHKEVELILQLKSGGKLVHDNGKPYTKQDMKDLNAYLAPKASYFIMCAPVTQYYDSHGRKLPEPVNVYSFYASYPEIRKGTLAYTQYVGPKGALINPEKLTLAYTTIIELQIKAAIDLKLKSVDFVTPEVFLKGLSEQGKIQARECFMNAIKQAVNDEKNNPNMPMVFIHNATAPAKNQNKATQVAIGKNSTWEIPKELMDNIAVNLGDAVAPAIILKDNERNDDNKHLPVHATCIMGDPNIFAQIGNKFLAFLAGNRAKEEIDTRKSQTFIQLCFNAFFNSKLFNNIAASLTFADVSMEGDRYIHVRELLTTENQTLNTAMERGKELSEKPRDHSNMLPPKALKDGAIEKQLLSTACFGLLAAAAKPAVSFALSHTTLPSNVSFYAAIASSVVLGITAVIKANTLYKICDGQFSNQEPSKEKALG